MIMLELDTGSLLIKIALFNHRRWNAYALNTISTLLKLMIFHQHEGFLMNTALPSTLTFPEQLEHIKNNMEVLSEAQPAVMDAFGSLHTAGSIVGALDAKTKELIALAIAVAARCDGCIAFHTHDALNAGSTREEITDALGVAILMGGGPSVIYATHVIEAIGQFEANEN